MALTVTLGSLNVREADREETSAEWRVLFRSLSSAPLFQAVLRETNVRDGGFRLNTFVDDGRFACDVGWRVDFT